MATAEVVPEVWIPLYSTCCGGFTVVDPDEDVSSALISQESVMQRFDNCNRRAQSPLNSKGSKKSHRKEQARKKGKVILLNHQSS